MAVPFAEIELSVAADTQALLANAEGTLDGQPVTGIFDTGFEHGTVDGYGEVGSSPTFATLSANVPANPEGKSLVITAGFGVGSYLVANAFPDAGGITTLQLLLS